RTKREVAQNLLGISGRLLQVQALAQTVGTDDEIVIGQTQLDDGMPADEAPLPRRHLLAHHPRVAAAEQMDQSLGSNRFGTQFGGPVQRLALVVEQTL